MLHKLYTKAQNIANRTTQPDPQDKPHRLSLPHSDLTNHLSNLVNKSLTIATSSGIKIGDICQQPRLKHNRENSQVYSIIPCGACDRVYIGETHRGIHERLKEHKKAVTNHDTRYAIVVHIDKHNHLPNWNKATTLKQGMTRRQRKIIESATIATTHNMNTKTGSHDLAKVVASLIARDPTTNDV